MSHEPPSSARRLTVASVLFLLTCGSTLYVGAEMALERPLRGLHEIGRGWPFALSLMSILLAHELGHYVAARIHRVPVSPPYFIPMPFSLLGTMGAVIHMPDRIRTRRALLDVGAAGPLAGLAVALPVLTYGLSISPVRPLPPPGTSYLLEGRSVLYSLLLHALHGPIPEGSDVFLSPPAMAGWAGLLVTMINLLPVGQLDGGHVAYALLGKRQDRASRVFLALLPVLGLLVGLGLVGAAVLRGSALADAMSEITAGFPWIVWSVLLLGLQRVSGSEHPPTDDDALGPGRRAVAMLTLALFPALFMPYWMRVVEP